MYFNTETWVRANDDYLYNFNRLYTNICFLNAEVECCQNKTERHEYLTRINSHGKSYIN